NGIPVFAERLVPARIFGFEPIALFRSHASVRIPPEGRPPVPKSKMNCMMVPTEFSDELIPVPGFLHAEITELVEELFHDPLFHKLLERHSAMFQWSIIIH